MLLAAALVAAGCSSSPRRAAPTTRPARPTTTTAAAPAAVCPLTGAPVPGGGPVPARPALGVKVDNAPEARPQTGLSKADIVVEEPVEGGITRYVAIYQCQNTILVGPVRSARNIDIGIMGQFGAHPLLAHVGGIDPVLANLDASPIIDLDLGDHPSIVWNPPGRVAPYDTYTSTADLWGLAPSGDTAAPAPVFTYSTATPSGVPAGLVSIPFSDSSPVYWRYDKKLGAYLRYYNFTPDMQTGGIQNSAANVVVQFVDVTYGPWLENDEGGLEVQANLYDDAGGFAEVFRGGVEIPGHWQRDGLASPTQFLSESGATIPLQPGQTWIELVPTTVTVTVSP